jgi:hypothetical protein
MPAVHALSDDFEEFGSDVIVDALAAWCTETSYEPDLPLMSRAIELYNRGNDTSEKLLHALRRQLRH